MKQRLLSLLAVAALALTAMAQTWTAPVAPSIQGSDPEDGGIYYIMNVGCGQFIIGANAWATQISVSTTGEPYFTVVAEAASVEEENPETGEMETVNGFKLKMNGTFYFTGDHNRVNFEVSNKYLFRDGEENGFVDLGNQVRNAIWVLTKNENGNYYIQSTLEGGTFPNARSQYAGVNNPGDPVKFNWSINDHNIEWRFVTEANYGSEYSAALLVFTARKALYDMYLKAIENNVDPSAYENVYNNANATVEQLNAATESLKADITRIVVTAMIAEASESNPIDITSVTIENPDFEYGQKPWTITEGMGQNLQVQGTGYPNDGNGNPADGYDSFVIKNFIEAWRSGAALSDGVICQAISGLPAGRYRIEADVMAVRQYEGEDDQKGIYLFYNNGSYTIHSESLSTGNGFPEHFSFDFDYSGNATMTIGLMAESTNCNWMGMDNFRLYAIGECKDAPSWTALVVAYNTYADYTDDVKAESAKIEALQDALSEASPLVNAPSDYSKEAEYTAAIDKIDEARKALDESIAAYKKLDAFVAQLNADQEKYTGDLQIMVEELYEQWQAAYEEGTATPEEIEAAITNYAEQIKQKTQELFDAAAASGVALDTPIDITPLFDTMSYAYGTSQTAFSNGYPATDPVWIPVDDNFSATSQGNFKTNYSTAEVWNNRPFNICREITNLPKGSYTIKTHAFFRVEANDNNYPNYQEGAYEGQEYAYLYAGVVRTPITNVAAIASDILSDIDNPYDCGDGNYLPNNQHSAYMIFSDSKYAELAEKCYIGATGNVLEDGGSLRVGIAGTNNLMDNQWTIWYSFELYYNGIANLDTDIQALIDQLTDTETLGIPGNESVKTAALSAGNAAIGADIDTQTAAIKQLQGAIAEINRTQKLVDELILLSEEYTGLMGDPEFSLSPTDSSLDELLTEIDTAIGTETYESNAQIEGWISQLPQAWVKYVTSAVEMAEASVENPINLTYVILNADFSADGSARGVTPAHWTADGKMGQNQGYQDNNTYTNEEEDITLSQFLEAWNSGNAALADGSISQTIAAALPEGFYRLSVNGYATNQANEEVPEGVYLFANGNSISIGNPNSVPQHFVLDFAANGTGLTTVGIFVQSTTANWFAVDNFMLEFLGKEMPDAISSLEADSKSAPVMIFSVDGRQQSQLRRGINIVRKEGNVQKVLVK